MAAGKSPFDIMLVDDIWFPEFAQAGWLKDISADIPAEMKADSSQAAWDIVSYDGKQYGLPWLLDQLYLYYNEDMLTQAGFTAPPTTWEEMMSMAQVMHDKGIVDSPIVMAWAQAEAAITEFVAFLYGNGAAFFDDSGKPVFNSPQAVAVLQWMVDSVKSGLVNPASTTYVEEDIRTTMQAGKAAFGVNWAYEYDLANDPANSAQAGKIKMAMMPVFQAGKDAGIVSSSNNGSMGFAVSAGSAARRCGAPVHRIPHQQGRAEAICRARHPAVDLAVLRSGAPESAAGAPGHVRQAVAVRTRPAKGALLPGDVTAVAGLPPGSADWRQDPAGGAGRGGREGDRPGGPAVTDPVDPRDVPGTDVPGSAIAVA